MKMVRKQVYITQEQEEWLKRFAAERDKTEAEVIRDALDSLGGVTHGDSESASRGRLREVTVMEYSATEGTAGSAARGTGRTVRSRLADEIWQRELAFLKGLAGEVKDRESEDAWKFDREELYEERESKILRRY